MPPDSDEPDTGYETEEYASVHPKGNSAGTYIEYEESPNLSPKDIADRIWTGIKELAKGYTSFAEDYDPRGMQGTKANVTCVHQGHVITGNLADTLTIAVAYDEDGQVLDLKNLTESTHQDTHERERMRFASDGLTELALNRAGLAKRMGITRAIGHNGYNLEPKAVRKVVISDAALRIYPLKQLERELNPSNTKPTAKIQIMLVSDGIAKLAPEQQRMVNSLLPKESIPKNYTVLLHTWLQSLNKGKPGLLSEEELANGLAQKALEDDRSPDNISVAVATCHPNDYSHAHANKRKKGEDNKKQENAGKEKDKEKESIDSSYSATRILATFDGKDGKIASSYAASNACDILDNQFQMAPRKYRDQPLAVANNQDDFNRDNSRMDKTITEKTDQDKALQADMREINQYLTRRASETTERYFGFGGNDYYARRKSWEKILREMRNVIIGGEEGGSVKDLRKLIQEEIKKFTKGRGHRSEYSACLAKLLNHIPTYFRSDVSDIFLNIVNSHINVYESMDQMKKDVKEEIKKTKTSGSRFFTKETAKQIAGQSQYQTALAQLEQEDQNAFPQSNKAELIVEWENRINR